MIQIQSGRKKHYALLLKIINPGKNLCEGFVSNANNWNIFQGSDGNGFKRFLRKELEDIFELYGVF